MNSPEADWNIEYIYVRNWPKALVSVCQFGNKNHHIVVHRDCWAVVSKSLILDRVFAEALTHLKKLPDQPKDYMLYQSFVSNHKKLSIIQSQNL